MQNVTYCFSKTRPLISMWRKKYIYHKWMCHFCLSRFITWKSTHQNIKQTSQREPTAQRKKTQNRNTETRGWGSKTSRWFPVFFTTLISLSGSNFNIWCCNVSFFSLKKTKCVTYTSRQSFKSTPSTNGSFFKQWLMEIHFLSCARTSGVMNNAVSNILPLTERCIRRISISTVF